MGALALPATGVIGTSFFPKEDRSELILQIKTEPGSSLEMTRAKAQEAVRIALKQPGDSARHDDHMHVRVYCSKSDREFGCVDMGPMELLAEREAEHSQLLELVGDVVSHGDATKTAGTLHPAGQVMGASAAASLGARADRIDLRGWR